MPTNIDKSVLERLFNSPESARQTAMATVHNLSAGGEAECMELGRRCGAALF
jgi:hypothetical protein